jgi:hypothetical protein
VSTLASDMFFVVQELNASTGEPLGVCLQYGGWNYIYPNCVKVDSWPVTWNKHLPGWYNYTADLSTWGLSGSAWEVCVGNGFNEALTESYHGFLYFTESIITTAIPPSSAPTSIPSSVPTISFQPTSLPSSLPSAVPTEWVPPTTVPTGTPSISPAPTSSRWTVASECFAPLRLHFDLSLAGGEYLCMTTPATGAVNSINISLYFSGSNGMEQAYDMAFAVKDPSGVAVQAGGFNYYLPNISYAGPWPFEWHTSTEGWYAANISTSMFGVEGEGEYTACLVNAWVEAGTVSYEGTVLIDGLVYDCDPPSPAPTPLPSWSSEGECSENVVLDYDLHLEGFETSCTTLEAAGFIQDLDIALTFSGSVNGEWPADMSLSVKFEDGMGFRIGGFNDEDPDLVYLGSWPPTWRNSSDGTYVAFMNISEALIIDSGEVQVCMTNGWEYAHSVGYVGRMELLGLLRTCDKKKSNNDDDDNQTALALGLAIPLGLIALAVASYLCVSGYQKQEL